MVRFWLSASTTSIPHTWYHPELMRPETPKEQILSSLSHEGPVLSFLRFLKLNAYLDFLLVKMEMVARQEVVDEIRDFIRSKKQKYLIFAINHHSSDADGVASFKAIETQFPSLIGKLAIIVD